MNRLFSVAAFVLAAVVFLVPRAAFGQVELIVRLDDAAAPPVLVQTMQRRAQPAPPVGVQRNRAGGPPADTTAYPQLFRTVQRVQTVFGAASAGAAPQRPQQVYALSLPDSTALEAARARWAGQPGVRYAQRNHRYTLDALPAASTAAATPNDPLLDSLDYGPLIRVAEAWPITTGRPEVRVGVIDTGFFFEHPDLAEQAWINPGEDLNGNGRRDAADFNGADDDGNGFVDDVAGYDFVDRPNAFRAGDYEERDPDPSVDLETGSLHGTAVAGVIAAAQGNATGISGVAPGTRLVPLRAFAGDGAGSDDDIAAAIVYAADLGVDVLNFSFGDIFYSPLMEEAVQYAASRGVVLVGSAGNSGRSEPHYPSDYQDVISVTGLSKDGTQNVFFSKGPQVDLSAPGTDIYTTLLPPPDAPNPGAEDLYGRISGTSFAAPMVAGAAALLRSADASLSAASIRSALTATATDLGPEGTDESFGAGRLDVAAALLRAYPARTEIVFPEVDDGFAAGRVPIVGSAIDPAFASYRLEYAVGNDGLEGTWQPLAGPFDRQTYRDTLAVWDVADLPEATYTLRLVTTLRTGRTVEAARRVFVDGSPPVIDVRLLEAGLVGPYHGVLADVRTDDFTRLTMRIRRSGSDTTAVPSAVRAYRHGLIWPDEAGRGGPVQVTLEATNAAGLTSTETATVTVPAHRMNAALFAEEATDVSQGYLLPRASDFDGDGLLEMTFNQFTDGGALGDTLATYEWAGDGFRAAQKRALTVTSQFRNPNTGAIITSTSGLIPQDVGDTDGDGLQEVLAAIVNYALLLEQPQPEAYPDTPIFRDSTGQDFSQPAEERNAAAVNAALLDDLDQDGRAEIVARNNANQWRLLERREDGFEAAVTLGNPTAAANPDSVLGLSDRNAFGPLQALAGDFDGDGRRDLLVGDVDGDWIVYESTGDDAAGVAWTFESDRYNAGARFAKGDFDGDGVDEFVTYNENYPIQKNPPDVANTEVEPPFGFYYFWDQAGDDAYELRLRLPVLGPLQADGALTAADFDGDGRDEVALLSPPRLYVMAFEGGRWQAVYQRSPAGTDAPDALQGRATLAADFDGNGSPELVTGAVDGVFRRFVYQQSAADRLPPRWTQARPLGADRVALAWRAPGADSVTVFRGSPDGPLDRVAGTADSSVVDETTTATQYRLRAWYGGDGSPLSEARAAEPHAPAQLVSTAYPDTATVRLAFSRALSPATRAAQFRLEEGPDPEQALLTEGGRVLLLRFAGSMAGRADTLRWRGLVDAAGLAVPPQAVALRFPPTPGVSERLIVASWDVTGPHTVVVTFDRALDAATAADAANYALRPSGSVESAALVDGAPQSVRVRVAGRRIGAVGQRVFLTVQRLRGADGAQLAPEGRSIQLTEAAASLADVFVYPNPFRAGRHEDITVAGLPPEATVRILSVDGRLVTVLEETGGDGGAAWDLTDRSNRRVPPGVYLIRVEAPGEEPVLKKAAVIR